MTEREREKLRERKKRENWDEKGWKECKEKWDAFNYCDLLWQKKGNLSNFEIKINFKQNYLPFL